MKKDDFPGSVLKGFPYNKGAKPLFSRRLDEKSGIPGFERRPAGGSKKIRIGPSRSFDREADMVFKKKRAPVVVVTGGTGSGKSTVAAVFKKLGARVIDVDRFAHRLLKPGSQSWREIISVFCGAKLRKKVLHVGAYKPADFLDQQGNPLPELPWVINAAGVIRRDKLGATAFADPANLEMLNKIMHVRLRKLLDAKIKLHHQLSSRPVVLDMAVYPEKAFRGMGDIVLWVRAPGGLRVQRLADSKRLSLEEASARVRLQSKDEEYEKCSDFILPNLGSDMDVKKGAEELWPKLLSKTSSGGGR